MIIENASYAVHCPDARQEHVILPSIYRIREGLESVPVDASIVPMIRRILAAGWYTCSSCSGTKQDHPSPLVAPRGAPKTMTTLCALLVLVGNKAIWDTLPHEWDPEQVRGNEIMLTLSNPGESDKTILARWERVTKHLEHHRSLAPALAGLI